MKDKITVKLKDIEELGTIIEFYDSDNYLKGCIYDHTYDNDFDFSFIFDYLGNIHWSLEKFKVKHVQMITERFEDWLDSYENRTYVYEFLNFNGYFKEYYDDFGNGSVNVNLEDVFKFVSDNSNVEIEFFDCKY